MSDCICCRSCKANNKIKRHTEHYNAENILRIALVGNPNCGKTTLFNSLTGMKQHTANYPGVTVDMHTGEVVYKNKKLIFIDLPGTYSIENCIAEETVTRNTVMSDDDTVRPDAVIAVVDATAIRRSMGLVLELRERGIPCVVSLTMTDIAEKHGMSIKYDRLRDFTGTEAIAVHSLSGEGIPELLNAVISVSGQKMTKRHIPKNIPDSSYFSELSGKNAKRSCTDKADMILTGRFSFLIFVSVMLTAGTITFIIGGAAARLSEKLLGTVSLSLYTLVQNIEWLPEWVTSLIGDGIIPGILGVISFLPQIAVLFFFIGLLEDCGYMARIAFITDGFFWRAGLSGKAAIPMMLGFGCTVTAVLSTRTLKSRRDRLRVMAAVPFISCGARLPVYLLIGGIFFPKKVSIAVILIYILGIIAAAISAKISRGIRSPESSLLFTELPDYRVPSLKNALLYSSEKVGEFIHKASTVIFAASVIMWIAVNFGPGGYTAQTGGMSFAEIIGKYVSVLLAPAGLGKAGIALALICGIMSKESIISSLYIAYGCSGVSELSAALSADGMTAASAAALMVFVLLYTPCAAALSAIRKESGSVLFSLFISAAQLLTAFIMSVIVYRVASLF